MPDHTFDRFKAKFGYVTVDLYQVRRGKTEGALTKADKALAYAKKSGAEVGKLEEKSRELHKDLTAADRLVEKKKSSEAYKLLDTSKDKARELEKEATLLAKKTPTKCKLDDGSDAKVYPSDIPGFMDMDDEQREEVVKQMAVKIGKGKKLVECFMTGDTEDFEDLGASREAVSDVMWYLKTSAESKSGEPYERGALTIPDPGNKMREFFDRCSDVYTRDSSHLKDQQKKSGGQARGIDFYDGVSEGQIADVSKLLPSGMRTVLLQSVETDNGEQRLYVKMETESARWNPFHKKQEGAPEDRPLEPGDRMNAILHLGNLIKAKLGVSQGDDESLKNFREKVPKQVTKAYEKVEKSAKGYPAAQKCLKKKKFVHEMMQAIMDVYALPDDDEGDPGFPRAFENAVTEFQEIVLESLPKKNSKEIEDLYSQFGGEVVLSTSDLTGSTTESGGGDESGGGEPPPEPPSGVRFFKQTNQNLCAYYALCHFRNRDVGQDDFLNSAAIYYQRTVPDTSLEDAKQMASDGNDPGCLTEFGLTTKTFGSADTLVVASARRGHFWVIRKADNVWWSYDGLKSGPTYLGDDNAAQASIRGATLYG